MPDLFNTGKEEEVAVPPVEASAPLAARMRPRALDEVAGQQHILGPGKLLRRAIEADRISSVLFYGPPGVGKTSLAQVIALSTRSKFERLIRHLQRRKLPLAFTWLHEIEFTNGLQLKVFRKESEEGAVNATLNALRSDVESGVFQRPPMAWPDVFERATVISRAQSRTLGTRTLDLLHVAAALALQAEEFVTGDDRQAKVAALEGLHVVKF